MKISVDGGALGSDSHFGTYTFSSSVIAAIQEYDTKNEYKIYTFENLRPVIGWMKFRVPLEECIHPKDVFLGLNQAIPLYTSGKPIIFSHGFSFRLFPQFYLKDKSKLEKQVQEYISKAKYIVVSSKKVYDEFAKLHPRILEKVIILPYGIPQDFHRHRESSTKPYFIFVGMNHGIKNIEFLVKSFKKFIERKEYKHFQLYLVGPHEHFADKNIRVFSHTHRKNLLNLYSSATSYLSASLYESFNFPVLEALSQQCPVIGLDSAIIPEMKKYCSIAKNQEDFIAKMIDIAENKKPPINLTHLYKDFSWRTFVEKLQELYLKP